MSHIVDDDPPIKTGVTSQAYRDNWDRIFGEKEPECHCPHQDANEPHHDTDCPARRVVTPEQQAVALRQPFENQWESISQYEACCRVCGFCVFVGADATINEHMLICPAK